MTDPIPAMSSLVLLLAIAGPALVASGRAGVVSQAVTGLVAHLFIAGSIYFSAGLWAPDAIAYDDTGRLIALQWTTNYNFLPAMTAGKEGYPNLLAAIYTTFGHHPFLGVAFNVALSPVLVVIVAMTAKQTRLPVATSAWLAALLPASLLWGSLGLREASSWVLLALVVLGLGRISLRRSHQFSDWLIIALGLAGMLAIRGTMAVIIAAAVALAVIPVSRHKAPPLIMAALMSVFAGPALIQQFQRIAGGYGIDELNTIRGALSREARSSSFEVASYSGAGDVAVAAPGLIARALFGPFPWDWPGVGPMFVVDGLIWLVCLGLLVVGVRQVSRPVAIAYLLPAAAIIVALAITSGNYGTMLRLRIQAMVIVLPLVAQGLLIVLEKRRDRGDRVSRRHGRLTRSLRYHPSR